MRRAGCNLALAVRGPERREQAKAAAWGQGRTVRATLLEPVTVEKPTGRVAEPASYARAPEKPPEEAAEQDLGNALA
eukprot:8171182-Lingulodinium_polyedra.AAC.1